MRAGVSAKNVESLLVVRREIHVTIKSCFGAPHGGQAHHIAMQVMRASYLCQLS
jgi:hypothetical protein